MPDDFQRDVAGRFSQAMRNKNLNLTRRWFPPEVAAQIVDQVEREVEDQGLQVESIEVICRWFRNDADAEWLDQFWQSSAGSRFLDLSIELAFRSIARRFTPHIPIPPPSEG